MNKNYVLATIAFLITFGLGFGTGYFINQPAEKTEQEQRPERERVERDRSHSSERIRQRFIRELNLTEEQQEPFFNLMISNRREMQQTMRTYREELDHKLETRNSEMMDELREFLTEDQVQKFKEQYSHRAFMERRRHRRSD